MYWQMIKYVSIAWQTNLMELLMRTRKITNVNKDTDIISKYESFDCLGLIWNRHKYVEWVERWVDKIDSIGCKRRELIADPQIWTLLSSSCWYSTMLYLAFVGTFRKGVITPIKTTESPHSTAVSKIENIDFVVLWCKHLNECKSIFPEEKNRSLCNFPISIGRVHLKGRKFGSTWYLR